MLQEINEMDIFFEAKYIIQRCMYAHVYVYLYTFLFQMNIYTYRYTNMRHTYSLMFYARSNKRKLKRIDMKRILEGT